MTQKIRVLVVDDSAVYREVLARELEKEGEFEVVGRAADPIIAKRLIAGSRPQVMTLDVEMPRQDGLSFLEELMRADPIAVVMVSSLTDAGAAATLKAFELGAVDAICKPRDGDTNELGRRVREAVRAAALARPRPGLLPKTKTGRIVRPALGSVEGPPLSSVEGPALSSVEGSAEPLPPPPIKRGRTGIVLAREKTERRLVAIGASTGGTEALKEVLRGLPRGFPPVVIVQHMPEGFTSHFAKSLSTLCELSVIEAPLEDTPLVPGMAVLAKGGLHLLVAGEPGKLVAQVRDGPPVRNHRPSVDVLFTSIAKAAGDAALGVILTGMGDDGARGMLKMREAGAHTYAQDGASCVVYGMPRRAVELGAVEKTVELTEIGTELMRTLAR
jgi:two-component system chemotaxis response regulator CheB